MSHVPGRNRKRRRGARYEAEENMDASTDIRTRMQMIIEQKRRRR